MYYNQMDEITELKRQLDELNKEKFANDEKKKKARFNKTEYMQSYMINRYHENRDEVLQYNRSVSFKKKYNLSSDDLKKYGKDLAFVYELRQLKLKLNPELFNKIVKENI